LVRATSENLNELVNGGVGMATVKDNLSAYIANAVNQESRSRERVSDEIDVKLHGVTT
jgi:hypothetical protein